MNVRKKNSNVKFVTKFLVKWIIYNHTFHVTIPKRHKTIEKERLQMGMIVVILFSAKKAKLTQHKLIIHEKRTNFKCDLWDFAIWKYECKKKEFKCDICLKCFAQMDDLQSHNFCVRDQENGQNLSVHRGKAFICDICPSRFTQKRHLKRHIELV